jgi:hypothetical protein
MPIVVYPVDRQMVGVAICPSPIPKVRILAPFVAKQNAATTITRKCIAMRVGASRFHAGPNSMQSREAFTVFRLHLCAKRRFPASARFDVAVAQQFSARVNFTATCTPAKPKHSPVCVAAGNAQCGQSTESLSSDIDELGHGSLPEGCSVKWRADAHIVGPLRIVARAHS